LTAPAPAPAPAVDDDHGDHGDHGDPCGPVHDPRDHGARLWDALIGVAQHGLDTDLPPQSHGAPTRLILTVGLQELKTGLAGAAVTGTTTQTTAETGLSVATLRRLACDAEIIPAVLGSRGEPLDVGRASRLVTAAIWVALTLRDRHCAFPGCDRPPLMCHAHHIRHWIFGGETKLSNLVLLCGHHHRVIHNTPWEVRLNPDDHQPEFRPPPKPGIETRWIRYRPRRE
jgi:hypothetical protein